VLAFFYLAKLKRKNKLLNSIKENHNNDHQNNKNKLKFKINTTVKYKTKPKNNMKIPRSTLIYNFQ